MFDRLRELGYEISFASHAEAIPGVDFPDIVRDLETALAQLCLPITEIVGSGGLARDPREIRERRALGAGDGGAVQHRNSPLMLNENRTSRTLQPGAGSARWRGREETRRWRRI